MTRAYKTLGWITTAAVLGIATAAHAHTLRLECKKITSQDVVCRAITSDGELARDIEIQLLATGDYRVLATGKTRRRRVCFQDTRCRLPPRRDRRQGSRREFGERGYLVGVASR